MSRKKCARTRRGHRSQPDPARHRPQEREQRGASHHESDTTPFAIMTVDHSFGVFGGDNRGAGSGELKKITEQTGGMMS
ncbi:MAG: hypothetical protein ACRD04_13415 [Terriglobales bacterium]